MSQAAVATAVPAGDGDHIVWWVRGVDLVVLFCDMNNSK